MSADAALVERMGNAVRAAYKAMEILKSENQTLRAENEVLKQQLSMLQPSNPVQHDVDRLDQRCSERPNTHNSAACSGREAGSHLKQQRPRTESVSGKEGNELGVSKFAYKSFVNAPDANTLAAHMKHLNLANLHFVAGTVASQNPVTLCKALVLTISSHIHAQDYAEDDSEARIPNSLLVKLDLLVSLLVSICGRNPGGLTKLLKLADVLRKVMFGAVRYQLCTPHYAVVMGALRVAHNVGRTAAKTHATLMAANDAMAARTESESTVPPPKREAADQSERKQRIASLASMIGLDSSDSGSGGESGSDADNDDKMLVDDPIETENNITEGSLDSDSSSESEVASTMESEVPQDDVDFDNGNTVSEQHVADISRTQTDLACRVYVLLSTSLRAVSPFYPQPHGFSLFV
jgi:hypothetical protein